jgi:hypothetical protein
MLDIDSFYIKRYFGGFCCSPGIQSVGKAVREVPNSQNFVSPQVLPIPRQSRLFGEFGESRYGI